MVISALKFLECAQGEWSSAGTFFGWLFLRPNFQSAPNVNVQCWRILWAVISVPKFLESTQGECANAGTFFGWLFLHPNFYNVPKANGLVLAHFLGGYFYAQIFRVRPM